MEPQRQRIVTERVGDETTSPVFKATLNITYEGEEAWTFDPDAAIEMAPAGTFGLASQLTVNFTDNSSPGNKHQYKMTRLRFTDASGNSIPEILPDWVATGYSGGAMQLTVADMNENVGGQSSQINFEVQITDKDGKSKTTTHALTNVGPIADVTIDITFSLDSGGNAVWDFDPEDVWMSYNQVGNPGDQVTFNLTDDSGESYLISEIAFSDLKTGKQVPSSKMQGFKASSYGSAVSSKTITDNNHNTQRGEALGIRYCITIMKPDGTTQTSDPVIWDISGGG